MRKYSEIALIMLGCSAMIYLIEDSIMDYRTANAVCNEPIPRKSYGTRMIEGKQYAICGGRSWENNFPVLKEIK